MKITKPDDVLILLNRVAVSGQLHTCVTIGYVAEAGGTLLTEQQIWRALLAQFGDTPFDAGLKKARGTFAVAGSACAPRGTRVPALEVRVRIGALEKSLHVYGDRRWEFGPLGWRQSEPTLFAMLPVDPMHAFGGDGWPENPAGRGYCSDPNAADGTLLANIEWPHALVLSPGDQPPAATFWPLPPGSPQRLRLIGKVDARWQINRFPHLPDDTDPRYFDAVAEDQCASGYWRGDETYEVAGMHAELPVVHGRLPGLQPRLLWRTDADTNQVWEAPLELDTVWLFPNDMRVLVLYRVLIPVAGPGESGLQALYVHTGRMTEPAVPREDLTARWRGALDTPVTERADAPVAVPSGLDAQQALTEGRAATQAAYDKVWAQIVAAYDAVAKEIGTAARAAGFEIGIPTPSPLRSRPDASAQPVSVAGISAAIAKAFTEGEQEVRDALRQSGIDLDSILMRPAQPAPELHTLFGAPLSDDFRQSLHSEVADAVRRATAIETSVAAALVGPAAATPAATPARVTTPRRLLDGAALRTARGESLERVRVEDADLSDIDLIGANLSGSEFIRCVLNGACLSGAQLADAIFTDCRLDGVNAERVSAGRLMASGCSWVGASLSQADLSAARCDDCDFTHANLSEAVLERSSFSKCLFAGSSLTKVRARRANFSMCDLTRTDFMHAELGDAIIEDGPLDEARFAQASLAGSSWWGGKGASIDFSAANLTGARIGRKSAFERSNFDGADLTNACASNTAFTASTLRRARLDQSLLSNCDLSGTDAYRVTARGADLGGSRINGARWAGANLMQASLRGTALSDVDLSGANLYAADTSGARFERVLLADALMTRFRLPEDAS